MRALATILPLGSGEDQIGIFDQDFNQVFINARPLKVTPKPSKKVFNHPLESGAISTDHIIFEPIEIEFTMKVEAQYVPSTYQEIKDLYENNTFLIVQTRADVYNNQFITQIPHEESAQLGESINIIVKLQQALIVNSNVSNVVSTSNSNYDSTVQRGQQQQKNTLDSDVENVSLEGVFP